MSPDEIKALLVALEGELERRAAGAISLIPPERAFVTDKDALDAMADATTAKVLLAVVAAIDAIERQIP